MTFRLASALVLSCVAPAFAGQAPGAANFSRSSWLLSSLRLTIRQCSGADQFAQRIATSEEGAPATIVKHAQTGTTPLELARVCKAWARVPAGIANARARSLAAPITNRELQKSTAEGRKGGQLFSVELASKQLKVNDPSMQWGRYSCWTKFHLKRS